MDGPRSARRRRSLLGFGQIAPTGGPCRAPQEGSPEDSLILMAEPAGAAGGVPQAPAQLWGQVDSGLVHGTILVPYMATSTMATSTAAADALFDSPRGACHSSCHRRG